MSYRLERIAEWMDDGLCREEPETFFAHSRPGANRYNSRVERAKSICAMCEVRSECLEYALDLLPEYGIWAGYLPNELNSLKRKRQRIDRSRRSA